MKTIMPVIVILSVAALLGGCSAVNERPANNKIADKSTDQTTKCTTIEVAGNLTAYNVLAVPEKQSIGILEDNGPSSGATAIQRYSRYSLSNRPLAPISEDLSAYVGKQVVVTGKQYKFELEGQLLDELWAKSISCR